MKQKLFRAQLTLHEAYTLARSNRTEHALANRILDALNATEDAIITLQQLESSGHYAN
jgi:hypothetical protein